MYNRPIHSGYFTGIVLAWSYIISCRWVEILERAGESSQMMHDKSEQPGCFWDRVTQSRWTAQVKCRKGVAYSPWILRGDGIPIKQGQLTPASTDSLSAFNALLGFCMQERESIEKEFLTGITTILMLKSRNAYPPKLAPPIAPRVCPVRRIGAPFAKIFKCWTNAYS
ncbi:hypothetical protein BDV12DRAFT_137779 [Aspergillus spectabilis]